MKLAHSATIVAPAEKVWAVVMDIPVAARCVPGVAAVTPAGPDRYRGRLLVQIGPVRLVLDGDIAVAARDDRSHRATLRLDAKDSRLGGMVHAAVDVILTEHADGCQLRIESDVQIAGRIGAFGQPVIKRKSDQLLAQFTECLARTVTG